VHSSIINATTSTTMNNNNTNDIPRADNCFAYMLLLAGLVHELRAPIKREDHAKEAEPSPTKARLGVTCSTAQEHGIGYAESIRTSVHAMHIYQGWHQRHCLRLC
jgi:hypothetical protein